MNALRVIAFATFVASTWTTTAIESRCADAAEKSDRAAIRTLLKQHADVNAPQADGMTALHWAAYHDDLEMAKALTDAKANVMVTNHNVRFGVGESFGHFQVVVVSRPVQCGHAIGLRRVYVSVLFEQRADGGAI